MDDTVPTEELLQPLELQRTVDEEAIVFDDDDRLDGIDARRPRIPGPGIPEALLWTFGVVAVHVAAGIVMIVVVILLHIFAQGGVIEPQNIMAIYEDNLVSIAGGEQCLFVLAALLAVCLRLRSNPRRCLAMAPIPRGHLVLSIFIILPLALVCGQLNLVAMQAWKTIVELMPFLLPFDQILEEMRSDKLIFELAEKTPLITMVTIFAIAPAIGEELVFRGVIGRGLVARWGVFPGILMTSFLFAVVHVHPAHAIALIPLAIIIHLAYVATRSLWAPMLIHFLNNALAVAATKHPDWFQLEGLSENVPASFGVVLAAPLSVLAIGALMWRTRVQYRLTDGGIWMTGYQTVEEPPRDITAVRECGRAEVGLVAFTVVCLLAFAFSLSPILSSIMP